MGSLDLACFYDISFQEKYICELRWLSGPGEVGFEFDHSVLFIIHEDVELGLEEVDGYANAFSMGGSKKDQRLCGLCERMFVDLKGWVV